MKQPSKRIIIKTILVHTYTIIWLLFGPFILLKLKNAANDQFNGYLALANRCIWGFLCGISIMPIITIAFSKCISQKQKLWNGIITFLECNIILILFFKFMLTQILLDLVFMFIGVSIFIILNALYSFLMNHDK